MTNRDHKAGTTDQRPKWEGPPETRPSGYLPADDNPEVDRDAAQENVQDPDRSDLSDAFTMKDDAGLREERVRARAHQIWEDSGRVSGAHIEHWEQAECETDSEAGFLDQVKENLRGDTADDLEGPKAEAQRASDDSRAPSRPTSPSRRR